MKSSLIFQILVIIIITFTVRELIYYFSVGGEIDAYFILNSLFFLIGVLAAFVSFTLFNRLKTQQELSMISLFLSIKEFKNEIKVLYIFSLISGISFFIYSALYAIFLFGAETIKTLLGTLMSIFAIFSLSCFLLFIICFILLARKWNKRFEKYGSF
jgi:hypothetical protein